MRASLRDADSDGDGDGPRGTGAEMGSGLELQRLAGTNVRHRHGSGAGAAGHSGSSTAPFTALRHGADGSGGTNHIDCSPATAADELPGTGAPALETGGFYHVRRLGGQQQQQHLSPTSPPAAAAAAAAGADEPFSSGISGLRPRPKRRSRLGAVEVVAELRPDPALPAHAPSQQQQPQEPLSSSQPVAAQHDANELQQLEKARRQREEEEQQQQRQQWQLRQEAAHAASVAALERAEEDARRQLDGGEDRGRAELLEQRRQAVERRRLRMAAAAVRESETAGRDALLAAEHQHRGEVVRLATEESASRLAAEESRQRVSIAAAVHADRVSLVAAAAADGRGRLRAEEAAERNDLSGAIRAEAAAAMAREEEEEEARGRAEQRAAEVEEDDGDATPPAVVAAVPQQRAAVTLEKIALKNARCLAADAPDHVDGGASFFDAEAAAVEREISVRLRQVRRRAATDGAKAERFLALHCEEAQRIAAWVLEQDLRAPTPPPGDAAAGACSTDLSVIYLSADVYMDVHSGWKAALAEAEGAARHRSTAAAAAAASSEGRRAAGNRSNSSNSITSSSTSSASTNSSGGYVNDTRSSGIGEGGGVGKDGGAARRTFRPFRQHLISNVAPYRRRVEDLVNALRGPLPASSDAAVAPHGGGEGEGEGEGEGADGDGVLTPAWLSLAEGVYGAVYRSFPNVRVNDRELARVLEERRRNVDSPAAYIAACLQHLAQLMTRFELGALSRVRRRLRAGAAISHEANAEALASMTGRSGGGGGGAAGWEGLAAVPNSPAATLAQQQQHQEETVRWLEEKMVLVSWWRWHAEATLSFLLLANTTTTAALSLA